MKNIRYLLIGLFLGIIIGVCGIASYVAGAGIYIVLLKTGFESFRSTILAVFTGLLTFICPTTFTVTIIAILPTNKDNPNKNSKQK